jgi:hypothetical protein
LKLITKGFEFLYDGFAQVALKAYPHAADKSSRFEGSKVGTFYRRQVKSSKHTVEQGQSEFIRGQDFDTDGFAFAGKINDKSRLNSLSSAAFVFRTARQIVIPGYRPAMSKCHFQIRVIHIRIPNKDRQLLLKDV